MLTPTGAFLNPPALKGKPWSEPWGKAASPPQAPPPPRDAAGRWETPTRATNRRLESVVVEGGCVCVCEENGARRGEASALLRRAASAGSPSAGGTAGGAARPGCGGAGAALGAGGGGGNRPGPVCEGSSRKVTSEGLRGGRGGGRPRSLPRPPRRERSPEGAAVREGDAAPRRYADRPGTPALRCGCGSKRGAGSGMQQPGGGDGGSLLLLPLLLLLRAGSRAELGDATQGKGGYAGAASRLLARGSRAEPGGGTRGWYRGLVAVVGCLWGGTEPVGAGPEARPGALARLWGARGARRCPPAGRGTIRYDTTRHDTAPPRGSAGLGGPSARRRARRLQRPVNELRVLCSICV